MTAALLFPGQGAQFAGMGRDFAEAFPAARRMFERADAALGFSLSESCWSDGDDVHRTDLAQPGILTTSAAVIEVLRERGLDTDAAPLVAGLSLGEYTALWCVGSLGFEDAVRLVRLRGEAMQAASEACPSGMLSLAGASLEQAETLAALGAEHGICQVANLNSPGQVVLSGETAALDAAEAGAADAGVRRAVRLAVAGGFHSECMRPAAERLGMALAEVEIRPPRTTFVTNVSGEPETEPDAIRTNLARQVCSPVLWEASLRAALTRGVVEFLEPAPGRVLAGLLKRIARDAGVEASCRSVERPEDVDAD